MSTTLTNGLKLPDKGSVDWYADMQSNYQILDGAVGTVAEHTTQIVGKAPLVHTHTKSDITDLFNSANTWTGDNTYSKPVVIERNTDTGNFLALRNSVSELGSTPASATPVTIAYRDKNDNNLSYMGVYYDTDGSNAFRLFVRNKFTNGAPDISGTVDYTTFQLKLNADKSKESILKASFRPYDNNTYDLGSSSYQWNNLYAKKTYTDTVKAGTGDLIIQSNGTDKVVAIHNGTRAADGGGIWLYGKDSNSGALVKLQIYNTTTSKYEGIVLDSVNFYPDKNNLINLGTSDYKWKTLNGVNPGALSLPNMDSTVSKSTELAAAIDKTQTANSWTADFTGILRITWFVKNLTGPFRCSVSNNADIRYATWGQTFSANDVWYFIISFPVQNGKTYYFDNSFTRTSADASPIVYGASAVYCLGNV